MSPQSRGSLDFVGDLDFTVQEQQGLNLIDQGIFLSFPSEGGSVTGLVTFSASIDIVALSQGFLGSEGGESCVATVRQRGDIDGTYNGAALLEGTVALRSDIEELIGAGCDAIPEEARNQISEAPAIQLEWSGQFDGRMVAGELVSPDTDETIPFTASLTFQEEEPEDQSSQTASGIEPPPIDPASVFFGAGGMVDVVDIAQRVPFLISCPERPFCSGAEAARDAFESFTGDKLEPDGRMSAEGALATAVGYAMFEGLDGHALFPSVRAAMPVIEELAASGVTYQRPDGVQVTVALRFLELLAARDVAGWDERFPQAP